MSSTMIIPYPAEDFFEVSNPKREVNNEVLGAIGTAELDPIPLNPQPIAELPTTSKNKSHKPQNNDGYMRYGFCILERPSFTCPTGPSAQMPGFSTQIHSHLDACTEQPRSSTQKVWQPDEERICKLTFIGKNLNRQDQAQIARTFTPRMPKYLEFSALPSPKLLRNLGWIPRKTAVR